MELKTIIDIVTKTYGVEYRIVLNTSFRSKKEKECRWAIAYYVKQIKGGSIRQLRKRLGYNSIRPIQIGLTDFPLVLNGTIKSTISDDDLQFLEEKLMGNYGS